MSQNLASLFQQDAPWTTENEPNTPHDWIGGRIKDCTALSLERNADERGHLTELITTRSGLAEPIVHVYQVFAEPGSVRAWIYHKKQSDRLVFTDGHYRIVLIDIREDSPTYRARVELLAGEDNPIRLTIPPFVVHGVGNIGKERSGYINFPTKVFNLADPDKFRLPKDSPIIEGGW